MAAASPNHPSSTVGRLEIYADQEPHDFYTPWIRLHSTSTTLKLSQLFHSVTPNVSCLDTWNCLDALLVLQFTALRIPALAVLDLRTHEYTTLAVFDLEA